MPLCGRGTTRTSGQVACWEDFRSTLEDERCARCAAKLAALDAKFEKRLAEVGR